MKKSESEHFYQVVEPDYKITIGVKKGEVVLVDYSEMFKYEKNIKDTDAIYKRVLKYLEKAKKMLLKKDQ